MKKLVIVTSIIATFAFNATAVHAEASTEQNVGFFSGAISGAAVGGPIGFFIGGVSGALLGKKVEKANQLDQVAAQLEQTKLDNQNLTAQVSNLSSQVEKQAYSVDGSAWITEGLTLNLMFTTNSSELSATDKSMIERLSNVLNEYPSLNIRLDGYADPRGSQEQNLALSVERTVSVKQHFASLGVSSSRLIIRAHGEKEALSAIGDTDGHAMDRRVSMNFFTAESEVVAQN